ncbi:MAG TPA: agmatine deiminase family protein [Lentisphaeria bacterium]|nr:agmatine deiminase family protein [Lentisphaerota bacterium]OQC17479.1 MAG: Agmatine deiminase [Lentisphaerae bacterium ADurb.Bin082]HPY90594.1 agmatine deiminase family protein [Lentisphaeria bacterium]HQC52682.1 agmatine deiminase family protein [Lentisphaeria bacterium]HQL87980.1 agmatine deiminase family protein [Lentisphaeria bacterium]
MSSLTPQEQGFVFPAEWERQESVLLSCPLNPHTWPDNRAAMEKAYAAFAAAISRYENVRLLCIASAQARWLDRLADAGAVMERVIMHDVATDDAWCRDHGPIVLKHGQTSQRAAVSFHYNAWGGKFPPWEQDDLVAGRMAIVLGLPCFQAPLIGEGGAFETNGAGMLLTTESVMLNPNRNPGRDKAEVEQILCQYLGVEQIGWLPSGLCGDDTDGHIDTLTRFFRKDAVLTLVDEDPLSPNYAVLQRNLALLQKMRGVDGRRLDVVPLPCPQPIRPVGWREEILPASYANFLIINGAVLVPTYRQDSNDNQVLAILGQAFPERDIVPIDCFDIVLEGGALHCLSQQVPEE